MSRVVERYTDELFGIFVTASSKHEAHFRSQDVLREMSADGAVLGAIFQRYLARPEVLNTRHYPVIGIDVELNAHYGLVANCWLPLPGRQTDITTKAIHHHGEMLLTSVTAFGPGYEHWTFSRPEPVDAEQGTFTMVALEQQSHPLGHVAFVDAYIGHVPLYPPSLTITLALWSHRSRTSWKDRLKRLALFRHREETLRRIAVRLGAARALDLKMVEYFDFCPTGSGFQGLRERREFPRGSNGDYLVSLFHVLQTTRHENLIPRIQSHLRTGRIEDPENVKQLVRDLGEGRPIESRLSPGHFEQPHANFTKDEIRRALAANTLGRSGAKLTTSLE